MIRAGGTTLAPTSAGARPTRRAFRMAAAISAIGLFLSALGACRQPPPPVLIPPVVVIHEGDPIPNLIPPTRLDVVMRGYDAAAVQRCKDMGGVPVITIEPVFYPVLTCQGVDY